MKKIIILVLLLCLTLPVFSQTIEELKQALAQTNALVEKLITEVELKDKTIENKDILLQEAIALMEKKDKTISDLHVTISTLTNDNGKIIDDLKKIINDQKNEIDEFRKIINDFIKKYESLSKTNALFVEVGYTTGGNIMAGIDYSFALWRFRFLTGVIYETPVEFGVKVGAGFSF